MSFESTSNPDYSTFIALSKYARWLPEEGRRETWEETVNRYVDFWVDRKQITEEEAQEIFDAIYNLEVMPSMRALMTAGPALDRDNVAGFNCSYRELSGSGESIEVHTDEMKALDMEPVKINMSAPIAFDEIMYILLCGTGVGFSVERQFIAQLPTVGHKLPRKYYERTSDNYPKVDSADLSVLNMFTNTIEVADSKYGWASALRILIFELYNGNFDINWDVSQVRPAGAPLKLFGGRASGPEPLVDLFEYTADIFKKATNRKLNSLEVHGLVCKIAEIVVVGGVRRSALISLSNLSDDRMRHAKSGSWWESNPEFALANNSACYTEKPGMEVFMREWQSLVESKSGERGIFNREASQKQAARNGRRDYTYLFGTNPCSEIILRNQQFCNLSEIVARATDSFSDLRRKAKIATIIGTLQSSLTDFAYLSPKWKENTQEEALLGVSITGIMDHPVLNGTYAPPVFWEREWLEKDNFPATLEMLLERLKDETIETNKKWAARLGVNQSAAITCVKPSGTVSQLVDSASGIHPRYSEYYIRTVRADKKDPLAMMMVDEGFPVANDVMNPNSTYIFSFPMKAPENAVFRDDRSAIQQLEHWLTFQRFWCEHKPSVTIYVKEHEWMEVGAWVYKYFDEISGVSFLPHSDHSYRQAPYQEITKAQYDDWTEIMPENIDWSLVGIYEDKDNTSGSQTLACTGGVCEVVDLIK